MSEDPLAGLMYLFHTIIQLRYIEHCAEIGRIVKVTKMRNSRHDNAMYACHIEDEGGLTVGDRFERVTGMPGWSVLRDCPPLPGQDG